MQLGVAVGADHEQARPPNLRRQELEQRQRSPVGAVQIIQNHDERLAARRVQQERCDAVKQAEPCLLFSDRRRRRLEPGQPPAHLGDDLRDVGSTGTHRLGKRLGVMVDAESANDLNPRPVRRRALALVAAAPQHQRVAKMGVRRQLLDQARLADPRLAGDQDELPASRERDIGGGRTADRPPARARRERPRRADRVGLAAGSTVLGRRRTGAASASSAPATSAAL